jgi:putative PEP-CTERM system histidine kinase
MSHWENILFWAAGAIALLSGLVPLAAKHSRIPRLTFFIISLSSAGCFMLFPNYVNAGGDRFFYDLIAPGAILIPLLWLIFSLSFARENYRIYYRSSRWWLLSALLICSAFCAMSFDNPLASIEISDSGSHQIEISAVGKWFSIVVLLISSFALINIESTYRAATGVYRRRLRAPFVVTAVFFAAIIFSLSGAILKDQLGIWHAEMHAAIALFLFPIVAAYLKSYQLQKSGVFVRGQAVYSSVGIILIGLYLIIVGGFGKVLSLLGSDIKVFYSILAAFFVIVLFMVVLLSSSLKRRFRHYLDASVYPDAPADYQEDLTAFSEDISRTLDPGELIDTLSSLLRERLHVDKLWLFLEHAHLPVFTLVYPASEQSATQIDKDSFFADWVFRHGEAIDMTDLSDRLSAAGESFPPKDFPVTSEGSVCMPLIAKRNVVGILFFERKSDAAVLGHKEIQFISAVGSQFALAALSARLSEELLAARQIESFHKFSAFIMHDLKNSISMLSMLMQNFRKNVVNPEFQESAFVTIQGAVGRMQSIISKLTSTSQLSEPALIDCNLADLIANLKEKLGIEQLHGIRYRESIEEIANARVDREQLTSIIENLIVNAVEAMPQGGDLCLALTETNEHVVIEVSDTGTGMDQEFINRRLFRPFETTKSKGLGIGLYQSRDLLERMGGAFKVSSKLGEGTRFQVSLPKSDRRDKKE